MASAGYATAPIGHDANGNLTSDGVSAYTYDVENRLVAASNGAVLDYDPLGRLWRVTRNGTATRFEYEGDRLVTELDAAGAVLRRYMHGDGADEPLVAFEGPGMAQAATRALHADERGSIVLVTTAMGSNATTLAINRYDEWGVPTNSADGQPQPYGRFGYTGQAWLAELGLYYYKARMYSPTLGRFLQTDPIGYEDGLNWYAYVGNDPVNGRDPTGTSCEREGSGLCGFARDFLVGDIEDAIANPSATSIAIAAVTTVFKPAKVLDKAVDSVRALKKVQRAEATAERARNVSKGVPESMLGPSGKPKIHSVQHASRKEAQQAAKQEADRTGGRVRNDASPTDGQKPHFQTEDAQGQNVKPVVHHCRPGKDC